MILRDFNIFHILFYLKKKKMKNEIKGNFLEGG
jgi:hypothetical protein